MYIENPYRVMIVDDSMKIAEYFSLILQRAGMTTYVTTEPLQINHALITFKPELILMDLYMPKISGLELASILRLQPTYATIPIIFVSSEEDKSKQLSAMSLGGDDFITKPINPKYLTWSVKNRAARYRVLRNLMLKDSLTGLYNFTTLLHQLEIEVLRSTREKKPFCFVMIDLDHFKKVNDTYGHLTGNQILRTLALTLQSKLRRTDIIGRYGGEEFALVFPNTSYEQAKQILEELRQYFGSLKHESENVSFSVTFSAGISTCPPCSSSSEIIKQADQALYRAKQAGRNCIH